MTNAPKAAIPGKMPAERAVHRPETSSTATSNHNLLLSFPRNRLHRPTAKSKFLAVAVLRAPAAIFAIALTLAGGTSALAAEFTPPPIEVPSKFEVTLAAVPPLVGYPMMACFDPLGRLYVAESDGRNLTTRKEIEKELPRFVRRLVDTDNDGVFDQSTIFADKMTMPEGGLWHDSALYIISAPYLWRLEDTDDDGVADKREKILGEMEFDGRANQHGPYLGPNGRLYFSGGHFGYQFTGTDGSKTGQSRAGGVFSCRPDGSDVRIEGQGPINPVDVVFTKSGEIVSTAAIYDSFGGKRHDALIHWLPRSLTQRVYGARLLPETGHRMPAIARWGQVAPAGLLRYRGSQFGKEFQDNLFACHFNTNRVVKVQLSEDGATLKATSQDFLTSPSRDFHPADIIEDADGSLLLLDTGGWLSWGCPHSKAAKPEIKGAIYRIRRKDSPALEDPRGTNIAWQNLPPEALAQLLADPRTAVRDRAQAILITLGKLAGKALASLLHAEDTDQRRRGIFTLSQIHTPHVPRLLISGLLDSEASVRQAAARSLGERREQEALDGLLILLKDPSLTVRRNVVSALGRLGNKEAVEPLFRSLQATIDPTLRYAIKLALIEIGDPDACSPFLTDKDDNLRATALRVIEQIDPQQLQVDTIVPLLKSHSPLVRNEARHIVASRQDWKPHVLTVLRDLLSNDDEAQASHQLIEEIMISFANDEAIHQSLAQQLSTKDVSPGTICLLIECLGYLPKLPASTLEVMPALLQHSSLKVRRESVQLIVRMRAYAPLAEELNTLLSNSTNDIHVRLPALEALCQDSHQLTDKQFALATKHSRSEQRLPARQAAARALRHLRFEEKSLGQAKALCKMIRDAHPLTISCLLEPFESLNSTTWLPGTYDQLGQTLGVAINRSQGKKSLTRERLQKLSALFPDDYPLSAAIFSELIGTPGEEARKRAAKLEQFLLIADKGNASRGRALFYANRSSCTLCHTINNRGGNLGPDLSRIGEIREAKDLFEAIVFPSATVVNGSETYVLETHKGDLHMGLVHRETSDAIYLRQVDQTISRIPRTTLKQMHRSPVSLMPGGLGDTLSNQDLTDLVAFLQTCR